MLRSIDSHGGLYAGDVTVMHPTPPLELATEPPRARDPIVRKILGAFYEVYNVLGYGFLESVYARALDYELRSRGLTVAREVPIEVRYKGALVGVFRADFLVENRIVVELKATARPHPADRAQLQNYLRASLQTAGMLLHFGEAPAFWCMGL